MALQRFVSGRRPSTLLLGAFLLALPSASQTEGAAKARCMVPHPSNENWTLEGAELHYKLRRFYDGAGPPPLEEVFVSTQNLTREVQDTLMTECPGLLINAFLVLAESQLPISEKRSGDAFAKADALSARLTAEELQAESEVWPIQEAIASFTKASQQVMAMRAALPEQPRVDLVVCHCRESLNWLDGPSFYMPREGSASLEVFIYEKCNYDTDTSTFSSRFAGVHRVLVDDEGLRRDECSGYLKHLIAHYDDPADYTLFFQADASDHMHWGYLSLVMKSVEQHALAAPFVHLNYPRLITSMSPCRAAVFAQIFDRPPKQKLGSYCCAQFLVSRERILANPLERYERMQRMLFSDSPPECHDIPGHSTLCLMFEVYWHVLFGEADVLPYRSDNAALQLFLRIRDLENESYLPPGSMFLRMITERT